MIGMTRRSSMKLSRSSHASSSSVARGGCSGSSLLIRERGPRKPGGQSVHDSETRVKRSSRAGEATRQPGRPQHTSDRQARSRARPSARSSIRSSGSSRPTCSSDVRTFGRPARRAAHGVVDRQDQALEAAPADAQLEPGQPVQHRIDPRLRHGLQNHAEQPAGAGEIALPQLVSSRARQGRIDDLGDLLPVAQPVARCAARWPGGGQAAPPASAVRAAPENNRRCSP